ncbi:MAG: ABC transporter permease, partial [Pseudomonadota bacterium]
MELAAAPGRFFGRMGRTFLEGLAHFLALFAMARRLLILTLVQPRTGRRLVSRIAVEQVHFSAVQALTVLLPTAVIVGSLLVAQFSKIAGVYDLGRVAVLLLVREMGPVITALIVILRSGIAVTVEVSYMRVLHEIEAVEMGGMDPLRLIAYPRMAGITVAMLCLFFLFDLAAVFGGYTANWLLTDLTLDQFMSQVGKAVTGADIAVGALKALSFGIIISVVSLYRGFTVERRMTAIPANCSAAAMESMFYCLVMNIFISS